MSIFRIRRVKDNLFVANEDAPFFTDDMEQAIQFDTLEKADVFIKDRMTMFASIPEFKVWKYEGIKMGKKKDA